MSEMLKHIDRLRDFLNQLGFADGQLKDGLKEIEKDMRKCYTSSYEELERQLMVAEKNKFELEATNLDLRNKQLAYENIVAKANADQVMDPKFIEMRTLLYHTRQEVADLTGRKNALTNEVGALHRNTQRLRVEIANLERDKTNMKFGPTQNIGGKGGASQRTSIGDLITDDKRKELQMQVVQTNADKPADHSQKSGAHQKDSNKDKKEHKKDNKKDEMKAGVPAQPTEPVTADKVPEKEKTTEEVAAELHMTEKDLEEATRPSTSPSQPHQ